MIPLDSAAVPAPVGRPYRGAMAPPVEPPPPGPPTDYAPDEDARRENADSATTSTRRIDKFRRTAVGCAVAAGLLGVRDALEGRPEREEIAIVVDAPQSQLDSDFEVMLDPD